MSSSQFLGLALTLFILTLIGFVFWYFFKYRRQRKAFFIHEVFLPKAQKIQVDSFNICYCQYGKGPDLILLHGLGASQYIWRFVIKALGQFYRVTALDLPGFGGSSKSVHENYGLDEQATRVFHFLDLMKINKFQIIGSSMGGAIALWMATLQPKRVIKVVAMAPAVNGKIVKISPIPFLNLSKYLHKYFLGIKTVQLAASIVHADSSFLTTTDLKNYYAPFKNQPEALRTFILGTQLISDKRLPKDLAKVSCPTLLIWGEKDIIVPIKFSNELLKIIKNSKLATIDHSGHHPMEESPEECVKFMLAFLDK